MFVGTLPADALASGALPATLQLDPGPRGPGLHISQTFARERGSVTVAGPTDRLAATTPCLPVGCANSVRIDPLSPTRLMKRTPKSQERAVGTTLRHASSEPIRAREAAKVLGMSLDEFLATRRRLERLWDDETMRYSPIPAEYDVPQLNSAQRRRLAKTAPEALVEYEERNQRRQLWATQVSLGVPVWGGRKTPGREWTFDKAACQVWRSRRDGLAS